MAGTFVSFERFCRLCAKEQEVTLMLYSKEATDMLLMDKLKKYLQLEIGEDDKFSKNVCIKCCSTLQTLCEFIEQVRKAQENLHTLSSTTELSDSSTSILNAIMEEKTEFTEICIDPMDVYMPEETCTENYGYTCPDEVVTLKLIKVNKGKDETQRDETQENKQANKAFLCNVCYRSFAAEQSLKNHSWTHIQDEEYTCVTCQKGFRFQADLNKHVKSHKRKGPSSVSSCKICGRRFKVNDTYNEHMRMHMSSKKMLLCNVCGHAYANLTALKIHSITHSSEKPYQCNLCDKRFKRNQELKYHSHKHTGAKPYHCNQCNKSFARTATLHAHVSRIHNDTFGAGLMVSLDVQNQTGDDESDTLSSAHESYKYHCQICRKGCKRWENYVYHMYQHTGEKPYKCIQCTQQFITQRSLSSHYNKVHPTFSKPAMPTPVFCLKTRKWL